MDSDAVALQNHPEFVRMWKFIINFAQMFAREDTIHQKVSALFTILQPEPKPTKTIHEPQYHNPALRVSAMMPWGNDNNNGHWKET